MSCIIVAAPKTDQARHIAELIRKREIGQTVFVCSSGSAVLREANEQDSGIVICTSRLKDMSYLELYEYLPSYFGMLVMSKNAALELSPERMQLIVIPFTIGNLIRQIEAWPSFSVHRLRRKQTVHLKRTPKEQELIDRAKHILMEKQGLSEPEAYRRIQKQSMDQGRTFLESAQMIILLAETWE